MHSGLHLRWRHAEAAEIPAGGSGAGKRLGRAQLDQGTGSLSTYVGTVILPLCMLPNMRH